MEPDITNSTTSAKSTNFYDEINTNNKNNMIVESRQVENDKSFIIEDLNYGTITYPYLNNIEYENEINSTIFEEVQMLNIYYGDLTADSKINYSITRIKDDYLSLVFEGVIYNGYSAYPSKVLSCMIINRSDGKRVKLGEIVTIDDEFLKLFINNANIILKKMNTSIDKYYGDDIQAELENADTKIKRSDIPGGYLNPSVQTYLTDDNLVVRMEIAHVYGDFFDVFMPLPEVSTRLYNE
jgi:hypothetical protein